MYALLPEKEFPGYRHDIALRCIRMPQRGEWR